LDPPYFENQRESTIASQRKRRRILLSCNTKRYLGAMFSS
jgi:hypothetical protein